MKKCSKCKEIQESCCFRKQARQKDGLDTQCKSCRHLKYLENADEIIAQSRIYRSTHLEQTKVISKDYREKNKEKIKESKKKHYGDNVVAMRIQKREYAKNNPDKINARNNKRKAIQLNAVPDNLTKEDWLKIEEFYIEARRLTKETGIPHHVDHIKPLQGDNGVRGEHAPWNLQVLTATDNLKKGNKV